MKHHLNKQKIGLVFGKYAPITKGHISLIEFAKQRCDKLYVLVCANKSEPIPGNLRLDWVKKICFKYYNVEVCYSFYDEEELPATSESNWDISFVWAQHFAKNFNVDILFTSEKYGDYLSEIMGVQHIMYDEERRLIPISGTAVRQDPFKYWDFIPDVVKPYYVKKVCICGTESTGKSSLTEILAKKFETEFVHELGRDIVGVTEECTYDMLPKVIAAHNLEIDRKLQTANKIIFCDTDINTTQTYAHFLFDRKIDDVEWEKQANKMDTYLKYRSIMEIHFDFDLYLYLDNDAPYVQDGTRLPKDERDKLRNVQLEYLKSQNIKNIHIVTGTTWEERTQKAITIIKDFLKSLNYELI